MEYVHIVRFAVLYEKKNECHVFMRVDRLCQQKLFVSLDDELLKILRRQIVDL